MRVKRGWAMNPGLVGGIIGSVVGVLGGLVGTYFSIKNASRPKGRALMIRLAVVGWLWMAWMLAWIVVMPAPWRACAALWNLPLLFMIPRWNRSLAQLQLEDGG
jgi:hypothetical protein